MTAMGTLKVCLDPGHYGNFNCNNNVSPVYWESRTVWKLHLMLLEELEKYESVTVVTTRQDEEKDLELETRGKASEGCDLFLSLHTNSCEDETVDRATVIYQVKADDRMKALAAKFGAAIKKTMGLSAYKADLRWNSAHNADWYGVLRGAAYVGTPGLILEHGFHSHNATAKWLQKDANLRKLAQADAAVLAEHYELKKKLPFTDVKPGTELGDAVSWALAAGITKGTTATTFSPKDPCTRGQMAIFLFRFAKWIAKQLGKSLL